MGLLSNIAGRIERAFAGDKDHVIIRAAQGATGPIAPTGFNLLQAYGYDVLADYLRLDASLLERYADYEEMDDYPEIASAIDIFADDATQPDTVNNRTVWCTSKNVRVRTEVDNMIRRLNLDEEAWEITRSLVKYGNDFEELLVNDDGVIGLNYLPAPSVRRIEGRHGELYGFIQDPRGKIGFSVDDFKAAMAKRQALITGDIKAGEAGTDPTIAFEDWEVVHFRLRGKQRRSVYGHCLRKSSKVMTNLGVREIQHLRPGDVVQTFDGFKMVEASVLDVVCSGRKPVFSVKTRHREVFATAEHPVLVMGEHGPRWVPVAELRMGDRVVLPAPTDAPGRSVRIKDPEHFTRVRVTSEGAALVQAQRAGERYFYQRLGLNTLGLGDVDRVLAGAVSVTREEFARLTEVLPVLRAPEASVTHAPNRENFVRCPEFVDTQFARWFGFMLGDGWMHGGSVAFALGDHADINARYRAVFESMGLDVKVEYQRQIDEATGEERRVARTALVHCTDLQDILHDLGFIDGVHNKRIPQWVYEAPREIREAVVAGLADADGWDVYQRGQDAMRIELANYELLRDAKALIDGLGWTAGNICVRKARPGKISSHPAMRGQVVNSRESYILHFHSTPLFDGALRTENVLSITEQPGGPEDVYDIHVDHPQHNFVADGLVVHNSVLDSARWIWRRLMLLEDAAMIYRLHRAPERFAVYVNVGDRSDNEAMLYLNRMRQQFRKTKYINPRTGYLDQKVNPPAQDEDFYIPFRSGEDGSRVEMLSAPAWQHMDDVEYFRSKLFAAMKIPRAYLGEDDGAVRAVLSSQDIRFARTVLRIQREVRNGIRKMARVHLAALNIDPNSVDFDIQMTVPSSLLELAQIEARAARADLAARMRDFVSLHWVLEHVFNLDDEEIQTIFLQRDEDMIREGKAQGAAQAAAQPPMDMGGGEFGGAEMGMEPGAEGGALPPEGEADAAEAPVEAGPFERRDRSRSRAIFSARRIGLELPSGRVMRGRTSAITERELFAGADRAGQRRVEEKLETLLKSDKALAGRLQELRELMSELRSTVTSRKR